MLEIYLQLISAIEYSIEYQFLGFKNFTKIEKYHRKRINPGH